MSRRTDPAPAEPNRSVVSIRPYLGAPSHSLALSAALSAAGTGGTVHIPADVSLTLSSAATVTGRTISGNGVINGVDGLTSLINLGGQGAALRGLTLRVDGPAVVNFTGSTVDATVEGCHIGGVSAAPVGIQINATGISGTRIIDNTISQVSYGVLTNSAATDLTDLRITGNTIKDAIFSDAIELNHPGDPYVGVSHVYIAGNTLAVEDGSGDSSGFGLGIAGATYVVAIGNTFGPCRVQGIHIEDDAAHIVVIGNTMNSPAGGIRVTDGDFITIADNAINSPAGTGIAIVQGSSTQPTRYVVRGNTIRNAGSTGMIVIADNPHYAIISGNVIDGCAGNGLDYEGTDTGTLYGSNTIEGNILTNNAGFGISALAHIGARITGNTTVGNTLGGMTRPSTVPDVRLPINDPTGEGSSTIASDSTGWVDLFPLGGRASGVLTLTVLRANNAANRAQALFDLSWDGTTLTAAMVGSALLGGSGSAPEIRADSGMLQGRATITGADGMTARAWAQLNGTVML